MGAPDDHSRPPRIARPVAVGLARVQLFVSVFATGAIVILIEILGTRVIGPVFGVSLFVWSALLAVTLGSLALGYYAGGVLADRAPTYRVLGAVAVVAGAFLCVVPLISRTVLRSAEAFGPRGGSLASAAVLFAPSLVTLALIGPIAVRLAASDPRAAGHGVGAIYAVSTLGSLVGTFVTAFLIIPTFETGPILFGAAFVSTLIGGAILALHWRRTAILAAALPVLAAQAESTPSLPPGFRMLDRSHSLYGLVEVVDDLNQNVRFLRSDHSVLGAEFLHDHSSGFAFIPLLETIRFLRPDATSMLQIGLGTGALPSVLQPQGIHVDVVEIDPAVVRFARQYFGFATQGQVYEEDARTFLRRTERRYDLIVHDTFTGGTTPEHLLSLEVLQRIHELLRSGGVMALNFVGYRNGPRAEASWALQRTMKAVFAHVRAFGDRAPDDEPNGAANLVFFASDAPLTFRIPADAKLENAAADHVLRSFQAWEVLQRVPDGPLITDDRNPLARLQLPIAEEHFDAMNKLLPVDVWLH